jgi:hypothetical protein
MGLGLCSNGQCSEYTAGCVTIKAALISVAGLKRFAGFCEGAGDL